MLSPALRGPLAQTLDLSSLAYGGPRDNIVRSQHVDFKHSLLHIKPEF